MSLKEDMAAALPDMFATLGEPAVFTPLSGDPVACHVNVIDNFTSQPVGMVSKYQQGTVIEAILSQIGRVPVRGETFTVGTTVYAVHNLLVNDGLTVKVVVT